VFRGVDNNSPLFPGRVARCHFLLAPLLVCLFSAPAFPQRAQISGQVTDQVGSPLPDVKLSLLNLTLGLSRELASSDQGAFHFVLLQPGEYVLTAQRDGFGSAEVRDLHLYSNQMLRLRISLRIGAQNTVIRVNDDSDTLFSASPSLGGTVASNVMNSMPMLTRDVNSLALLFPGVLPLPPDVYAKTSYRISGGRPDTVTFLLDDGLDNDLLYNQVAYTPNLDSIAEFRVQTSSYPAEYGRNSGGIIGITTKSGTTDIHGSLFDYFREDRLNANSFFDNLKGIPRDDYLLNQFGVSLGGPAPVLGRLLGTKKLFYFLSYEGARQKQRLSNDAIFTYTPAELQGDFSQAGQPNPVTGVRTPDPGIAAFLMAHPYFQSDPVKAAHAIIDPATIDAVAGKYISAGLIPTSPSGFTFSQGNSYSNSDALIGKFDYLPSASNHFSLTVGANRIDLLNPFTYANVPGFPTDDQLRGEFVSFSYSKVFSPRLLNNLKISVNRNDRELQEPDSSQPTAADLGINIHPDVSNGPPLLLFSSGMQVGYADRGTSRFVSNTYTLGDTVSWQRDKHQFTFGAGLSIFQNNTNTSYLVNGQFVFYGTATSNDLADFLLGFPSAYLQAPNASSHIRSKFMFGFAQDEWKIAPSFSVNFGIRYEYSTPKTETQNQLYSIIPGRQSTQFPNAPVGMLFPGDAGAPQGTNFPDRDNWAPRFSFSWAPRNNQTWRIRGGFGMFYDILNAEDNLQFIGQEPFASSANLFFDPPNNFNSPQNYLSNPFVAAGVINPFPSRTPPRNLDFAASGLLPVGDLLRDVFVVNPHLQTPYTYQYGVNLETKLAATTLLQIGYVGNSAHDLTALVDVNPMVLGTPNRVLNLTPGNSTCTPQVDDICSFAAIREFKSIATASYNSLQVQLRKAFSQSQRAGGSYLTFGYTYSHTIDSASGFDSRNPAVPAYSPNQFRASSDSDLRHYLVSSGTWTLPLHYYFAALPARLTDGWSIAGLFSWRTGFPLDVFANLPTVYSFTSPGPSGAGDPGLVRANLVAPYQAVDPRSNSTFNGVSGNFWFSPNSFSNARCPSEAPSMGPNACVPGATMLPSDSQVLANPALRTYGTVPRNFFRGPGRSNLDFAISKSTSLIRDGLKLEARIEFFNALNHTEFLNPSTNIQDYFFGQITQTASPRIIQLGLRLNF
jgi:hypothetical protein